MTRQEYLSKIHDLNWRYGVCTPETDSRRVSTHGSFFPLYDQRHGIYAFVGDSYIPLWSYNEPRNASYASMSTVVKNLLKTLRTDGAIESIINNKNGKTYHGNCNVLFDEEGELVWMYTFDCRLIVSSKIMLNRDDEMCKYINDKLLPLFKGAGVPIKVVNGPVIAKQRFDVYDINDFNYKLQKGLI